MCKEQVVFAITAVMLIYRIRLVFRDSSEHSVSRDPFHHIQPISSIARSAKCNRNCSTAGVWLESRTIFRLGSGNYPACFDVDNESSEMYLKMVAAGSKLNWLKHMTCHLRLRWRLSGRYLRARGSRPFLHCLSGGILKLTTSHPPPF